MDAGQKHTQSMQPNGARVGADPDPAVRLPMKRRTLGTHAPLR